MRGQPSNSSNVNELTGTSCHVRVLVSQNGWVNLDVKIRKPVLATSGSIDGTIVSSRTSRRTQSQQSP